MLSKYIAQFYDFDIVYARSGSLTSAVTEKDSFPDGCGEFREILLSSCCLGYHGKSCV